MNHSPNAKPILVQPREPDPKTEWMDIDPLLAAELLQRNSQNRPKRSRKIDEYAGLMQDGQWKVTGTTVQFGKSGRLVDGQNRLQAIIDSGVMQRLLVVWGVDDSAFDVIDAGSKRTGADMLHIEGYVGWTARTGAAAAQIAKSLEVGQPPLTSHMSAQATRAYVMGNLEIMQSVEFISQFPRKEVPLAHSSAAAMHWLMARLDSARADDYMHGLYTGENLGSGDMILRLRTVLLAREYGSPPSRFKSRQAIGAVIKVWNSMRAGRRITAIHSAFPRSTDEWLLIE